jgi:hypothetical protein
MKYYLLLALTISTFYCKAQHRADYLKHKDMKKDLEFLNDILQSKSSYQGLNGYDFQLDFDALMKNTEGEPVSTYEFGLFLSQTIGKIGDRHSFIATYELRDSLYFPLAFGPFGDQVLVVDYDLGQKKYDYWDKEFPYLKSIHTIAIETLIPQLLPREALAPKSSISVLLLEN